MADTDDAIDDLEEIAKYVNQTPRWVRREGPKYDLPLYRIGRKLRAYKSELDKWIKQQRVYD